MTSENSYRKRIYERYATIFKDSSDTIDENEIKRWGKAYRYYLRKWLPNQMQAKIVDLGCGNGKLLYLFKQLGYENISGVDISPEQVKLARQITPSITEGNVLNWLKDNNDKYDFITALDIVEHFYKDEVLLFLDTCYDALKPGGRLVVQTSNGDSIWGTSIRYGDFTHEVGFNSNSLSRLMRLSGFQDIETSEQGPVPWGYSLVSTIRYMIWQFFRIWLKLWNLVEIGLPGSGVYTRVFFISGIK